MGIFDSISKFLEDDEKKTSENREREDRKKRLDTLRNTMRSYMKKGDISETELETLRTTAIKIGMDVFDFERGLEMVRLAKNEYDAQSKNNNKGLFSKKDSDYLFFYSEDDVESYYEGKMGISALITGRGEDKLDMKVQEEMLRPHFDSAFDQAFDNVILNYNNQATHAGSQPVMAPPPMPSQVQYTLNINGQNNGPYNMQQLQQMAQNGQFTRQTYVWKQGMANWEMAGNVQELATLFGAVPPPPPCM